MTFSANGTNAAKSVVALFAKAGSYDLLVTISDGESSTTSSVTVVISQTLTSIAVSPATTNLYGLQTRQISAVAKDQFGDNREEQPSFAWFATAGSITTGGFYTAPVSDATVTITTTSGATSGVGTVYVTGLPAHRVRPACGCRPHRARPRLRRVSRQPGGGDHVRSAQRHCEFLNRDGRATSAGIRRTQRSGGRCGDSTGKFGGQLLT